MSISHKILKARQRKERGGYNSTLQLRVHRALSWLDRAEQCTDDLDGKFIFLWIAFNAAYASPISIDAKNPEQKVFSEFLTKLLTLDTHRTIPAMLWQKYSGNIRVLLENPFVFQDFWLAQQGIIDKDSWISRFEKANKSAFKKLGEQDSVVTLSIVLSRIYTLRNQLVHGGATWNGKVNRTQVRDCGSFMGELLPLVLAVMMDHPDEIWGQAVYPVVDDDNKNKVTD